MAKRKRKHAPENKSRGRSQRENSRLKANAPKSNGPKPKAHSPRPQTRIEVRPDLRSGIDRRGAPGTEPKDPKDFKKEFIEKYKRRPSEGHHNADQDRPQRQSVQATGSFQKAQKGFGFVVFDKTQYEDLYVAQEQARNLFHGDRVEIHSDNRGNIHRLKVLERRAKEIVGRAQTSWSERGIGIVYQNKNLSEVVPLAPDQLPNVTKPKNNEWVRAKLITGPTGQAFAQVVEIYGEQLPATADIPMIAGEYGWIEHHSAEAKTEAIEICKEAPRTDAPGRTDFTHIPFITIDGERARDFDDAVYVERNHNSFTLWVAIADVAHYVRKGTKIDEEALARGTSVYFPERAFHMLPSELSENLCSLRPNELRYSLICKTTIDAQGKKLKTDLYNGVIKSRRRATYNEIQAEFQKFEEASDWEFRNHWDLYKILRKMREKRGSIDFDFPEAEIVCNELGEPTSIEVVKRLDAHRLIEEFMISANEAVSEWVLARKKPFIFRIHEEPNPTKLESFIRMAKGMGIELPKELENLDSLAVSNLLKSFEGHQAKALLSTMLLRSLKQAVYSADLAIHFGLASVAYTHFTSPIRRYPDLVAHRVIKEILTLTAGGNLKGETHETIQKTAEHCSYRERLSGDTEGECRRLKQVRLMIKHLGDEFDGMIVGTHKKGIFVQLTSPYVEGFIPVETLTDDDYQYNEDHMLIYGRRKKRTFKIGDPIRIQVIKASLESRRTEFALVDVVPETVGTKKSAKKAALTR